MVVFPTSCGAMHSTPGEKLYNTRNIIGGIIYWRILAFFKDTFGCPLNIGTEDRDFLNVIGGIEFHHLLQCIQIFVSVFQNIEYETEIWKRNSEKHTL